jgi:uncharacterized protein (DUF1330 family)
MSAYIILDIEITDPAGYEDYKKLAPPSIPLYGGKYLARGGQSETLEGDWQTGRIVVLEFPSMEKARAWLDSPEYAPARALRQRYAKSKTVLVEGV